MAGTKKHRIQPEIIARARMLRKEAPCPEHLLWSRLRAAQLGGIRFRRQHVIGPYVADFYCARARLVIELDRLSHEGRESYDAERTEYMESQGLRVIRCADDDVIRDVDQVVRRIACEIGLET